MANSKKRIQTFTQLALFIGVLIFLNILANARIGGRALYTYLDLTADKRFTLTKGTRQLLRDLDDVVYVKVLLGGKFPAGFKRLQTATRDVLEDFRSESGYVEYDFEDPFAGNVKEVNARLEQYAKDRIRPISLQLADNTEQTTKPALPYAIIYYKGRNLPVNLLEGGPGITEEALNKAIRFLEYKISNGIQQLQKPQKPAIVFTTGHGELETFETADLERSLRQFYNTGRVVLDSVVQLSNEVAVLVVAKPRSAFSEKDKFKIDQYVMNGGKVLWLIDPVRMDLDSLSGREVYMPGEYQLNLEDLFFKYGVRINPDFVLDMQCTSIELVTGTVGNEPQLTPFEYPYHVVVTPQGTHPVVKNLGPVNLMYPASIDTTIRTKTNLAHKVLLYSTPNSRLQFLPVRMNLDFLRYPLDQSKFDKGPQPLAVLMEGEFPSMFENRVTQDMLQSLQAINVEFKTRSASNRMLFVADGDIARNGIDRQRREVIPLGYNRFVRYQFDNKDFLLNAIEYLLDDKGVIEARGKTVDLRLLNVAKAKAEKGQWRALNLGAPLLFLAVVGIVYNWLRRRRFGRA